MEFPNEIIDGIIKNEGGFAVAYASILALINIRNMHLSSLAREIGDKLILYKSQIENSKLKEEVIANKKFQINEFTERYWWTGLASFFLILIIPIYVAVRIAIIFKYSEELIWCGLTFCFLLFIVGATLLILDLIRGRNTLNANNLIIDLEQKTENKKLKRKINEFKRENSL